MTRNKYYIGRRKVKKWEYDSQCKDNLRFHKELTVKTTLKEGNVLTFKIMPLEGGKLPLMARLKSFFLAPKRKALK